MSDIKKLNDKLKLIEAKNSTNQSPRIDPTFGKEMPKSPGFTFQGDPPFDDTIGRRTSTGGQAYATNSGTVHKANPLNPNFSARNPLEKPSSLSGPSQSKFNIEPKQGRVTVGPQGSADIGQVRPGVERSSYTNMPPDIGQVRPGAERSTDITPSTKNAPATPRTSLRSLMPGRGGDEYANVYGNPSISDFQNKQYIKDLEQQLQKYPDDPNLSWELDRMRKIYSPVKEASTNSDIGQFNPGADRLTNTRMPSNIGQFNPGADSLTNARMPSKIGQFNPGEDHTINPRMPSDIGQIRPGADRSAVVPSSAATASSTPRPNLRSLMPGRGGDEYTNVYGNTGPTSFQDQQYIKDLEAKVASDPNYEPWAAELWRMKNLRPNSVKETSMSSASKKSTGPKFPGYMRGDDRASAARSKMVGSVEESVQHRATVLMNRYKNFKDGK